MAAHEPVVGIDLASAHLAVSVIASGEAKPRRLAAGWIDGPALVHVDEDGEVRTGRDALPRAVSDPEGAAVELARFLGLDRPLPPSDLSLFPHPVARVDAGVPALSLQERTFKIAALVTHLLSRVRASASDVLGEPVRHVGIAFPCEYSTPARARLAAAARAAGFEEIHLVPDVTATAIALQGSGEHGTVGLVCAEASRIAVALTELTDDAVEVERFMGRTVPIGDDLVSRTVRSLIEPLERDISIDAPTRPRAVARLRFACESAFAALRESPTSAVEVSLPYLALAAMGPRHLDGELALDALREPARPMVDAFEHELSGLAKGGEPERMERWVITGRSPTVKFLAQALRARLPREVRVEPGDAGLSAHGAALHAARRSGFAPDLFVLQVAPHGIGVRNPDGGMLRFIDRFAPLPARVTGPYPAAALERQPVELLEGDGERADETVPLASFRLPAGRGQRNDYKRIDLVLEASTSGEVTVTARPPGGLENVALERVESTPSGDGDLGAESARLAEAEQQRQALGRTRLMLDSYLLSARRMLGEARVRAGAAAARELERALQRALECVRGTDTEAMREAAKELAHTLRGASQEARVRADAS